MSRYGRFASASRTYRSDDNSDWFKNSSTTVAKMDPAAAAASLAEQAREVFGANVKFRDVQAPHVPVGVAAGDGEEPEFAEDELEPTSSPSM